MFTGIIGALGTVESITPIEGSDAAYLTLNAGDVVADLEHGGSLAVNGVCLTAIDLDQLQPGQFRAYAMGETLRRTNLGNLNPGDTVNLERCLSAGGRFDGHVVQGHVDAVGTLAPLLRTRHGVPCASTCPPTWPPCSLRRDPSLFLECL